MTGFIVTGTDTGIGKTVVSALLTLALKGTYFKPIQAGLAEETDLQAVRRMTGLSDDHFIDEIYRLKTPASPHVAAEIDGVEIDVERLSLENIAAPHAPLIVEGAGGVLVPVTRGEVLADVFAMWDLPVVLCARTALGTINHSLLSIEALRNRNIPILGIVFVGDAVADSERTICDMGGVKRLGRVPVLDAFDAATLRATFAENFRAEDFA